MAHSARWPIVDRADSGSGERDERLRILRKAYAESLELLQNNRIVVVFPEGYPVIDPHLSPRDAGDDLLPFQPGFARIAREAARRRLNVPVVPAGLSYREGTRWTITLGFGDPIQVSSSAAPGEIALQVEEAVRLLSGTTSPSKEASRSTQEQRTAPT